MTIRIAGRAACFLGLLILGRGMGAAGQEPPPSPIPTDDPSIDLDLPIPLPELGPEQIEELEQTEKLLASALERRQETHDPARAAGLPEGSQPELLDLRRAIVLAALRAGEPDAPAAGTAVELQERARAAGLDDPVAAFRVLGEQTEAIESVRLFLDALDAYQAARQAGTRVVALDREHVIMQVYVEGTASSGISTVELIRVEAVALHALDERDERLANYRDRLEALKARLGLTPEAEVAIDSGSLAGFEAGFAALIALEADPEWSPEKLTALVDRLPAPPILTISGESTEAVAADPDRLEPFLRAAARAAVDASGLAPGSDADRLARRAREAARHAVEARIRFERGRQLLRFADIQHKATLDRIVAPPEIDKVNNQAHDTLDYVTDDSGSEARSRLVSDWIAAATARVELVALTGAIEGEDWDAVLDAFTTKFGDDSAPSLPNADEPAAGPSD